MSEEIAVTTATEFLEQPRKLNRQLNALLQTRAFLLDSLCRIIPVISDMPKGGGENKREDNLAHYVDLANEADALTDCYIDCCKRLALEIGKMEDETYIGLLIGTYIEGLTIEDFAKKLDRSTRRVKDKLLLAVSAFEQSFHANS